MIAQQREEEEKERLRREEEERIRLEEERKREEELRKQRKTSAIDSFIVFSWSEFLAFSFDLKMIQLELYLLSVDAREEEERKRKEEEERKRKEEEEKQRQIESKVSFTSAPGQLFKTDNIIGLE